MGIRGPAWGRTESGLIGGAGPLAILSSSFLARLVSPALAFSGSKGPQYPVPSVSLKVNPAGLTDLTDWH